MTRMALCLKRRGKSDETIALLFGGHSKYVYLTAVKPILQLCMRRLSVMFAGQMEMQQNIVNLI